MWLALKKTWAWVTTGANWKWLASAVGAVVLAIGVWLFLRERDKRKDAETKSVVAGEAGKQDVYKQIEDAAGEVSAKSEARAVEIEAAVEKRLDEQAEILGQAEIDAQKHQREVKDAGHDVDKMEKLLRGEK